MGVVCIGEAAKIEVIVVDKSLLGDHTYQITFEDTVVRHNLRMVPKTKNFTLTDITNPSEPVVLLEDNTTFGSLISIPENPLLNLVLNNYDWVAFNEDSSHWSRDNIYNFTFREALVGNIKGKTVSSDYRIEIG